MRWRLHLDNSFPVPQRSLEQLIADALAYLERLGYATGTIRHYRDAWRLLRRLAADSGLPDAFSEDLAERFLASRSVALAGVAKTSYAGHLRTAMRILSEFGRRGCFHIRQCIPERVPLSPSMDSALREYNTYCTTRLRASRGTMRVRCRTLRLFVSFPQACVIWSAGIC